MLLSIHYQLTYTQFSAIANLFILKCSLIWKSTYELNSIGEYIPSFIGDKVVKINLYNWGTRTITSQLTK